MCSMTRTHAHTSRPVYNNSLNCGNKQASGDSPPIIYYVLGCGGCKLHTYVSTCKTVSPSQLSHFNLPLIVPMAPHLTPHPRSHSFICLEAGQLPRIPQYLIASPKCWYYAAVILANVPMKLLLTSWWLHKIPVLPGLLIMRNYSVYCILQHLCVICDYCAISKGYYIYIWSCAVDVTNLSYKRKKYIWTFIEPMLLCRLFSVCWLDGSLLNRPRAPPGLSEFCSQGAMCYVMLFSWTLDTHPPLVRPLFFNFLVYGFLGGKNG